MAKFSLTKVRRFVQTCCSGPCWLGIDVHKTDYHFALLGDGDQVLTWVGPADPGKVVEVIKQAGLDLAAVVHEAGPTGFGLAHALIDNNIEVIVAAPSKIPRAVTKTAKTDRLDCIKLAKMAAGGMIKSIAVPTREQFDKRCLVRRREQIKKSITRTKQRIKSFLLCHSIAPPPGLDSWSKKAIATLRQIDLPPGASVQIQSLLDDLDHHGQASKRIRAEIDQLWRQNPIDEIVIQCLLSTPGVGLLTAAAFASEIFEPGRFHNAGQVASYIGLAPVVSASGTSKKPKARLIPTGQAQLRSLLVQAAWRWIRLDSGAGQIYERIKAATAAPQKAIVAVARKLAIILWRLTIEMRTYRPQPVDR